MSTIPTSYILADPNADETSLASGSFSITLNANDMNGPILGLHHTGGLPFTLNMLTTSLQVTRQRIQTILKTVLPSTSEIDGD
ncbi:hypothetical protein HMI56_005897 [Coelomomyces lativittatus]|nr:hypothetical protein HMI56_005897 [Coelomomyces lativittatus]